MIYRLQTSNGHDIYDVEVFTHPGNASQEEFRTACLARLERAEKEATREWLARRDWEEPGARAPEFFVMRKLADLLTEAGFVKQDFVDVAFYDYRRDEKGLPILVDDD